jgi:carboxymethylenebutenolidase
MSEKLIDIKTADGVADTWVFHPDGNGPWPAVILHTDIKGVRPVFEAMGRRLAGFGYYVVLHNPYYPLGRAPVIDPKLSPRDESAKPQFDRLRASISTERIHRDHASLLDFLSTQPEVKGPRTGIVGYCMSGAFALRAAEDFPDRIVAAASFHGGRLASDAADSPHLRAKEIRAALYLGYATEDQSMTDEQIATLEQALKAANVSFVSERYAGHHGFAVTDNASYDEASAAKHWISLSKLFEKILQHT